MASGRFGMVANSIDVGAAPDSGLSTVENWNLTDTKSSDSYVASNTAGGTMRGGGVRTWSGTFEGKGSVPPVMPNDVIDFWGYTTPATGTELDDGIVYKGPAIISSVSITWDWAANSIFAWTASFSGNPGLVIASGEAPNDATLPTAESTCGTKFTYDDGVGGDIEIPALVSATLTITAGLSQESNSSGVSAGECWITNAAGPIDWTLALPQEDWQRGLDGYPDLGADLELKGWTNATEYWVLNFGNMEEYSGLTVDRAAGVTISRTMNIAMQAANDTEVGQIVLPGGLINQPWWGASKTP